MSKHRVSKYAKGRLLHKKFKWESIDSNGEVYASVHKPYKLIEGYFSIFWRSKGAIKFLGSYPELLDTLDYTKSVIKMRKVKE